MSINTSGGSSSHGFLAVDWGSSLNHSSLLTHTSAFSRPNSEYPERKQDKVTNVIDFFANQRNAWWTTEFQVAFDHRTKASQQGSFLHFRVFNVVESDIQLEGDIDLLSQSVQLKGAAEKVGTSKSTKDWILAGASAVEKLEPGEWSKHIKNADKAIRKIRDKAIKNSHENKAWSVLADATTNLASITGGPTKANQILKSFAKNAGVVGSIVGVASDLFGFSGKGSNTPSPVQITPFRTTGTIKQSGTIKTSTQNANFVMNLPGIKPTNQTYYTCPIGVMNIENDLRIDKRSWKEEKFELENYKISNNAVFKTEKQFVFSKPKKVPVPALVFNYSKKVGSELRSVADVKLFERDRETWWHRFIKTRRENWKSIRLRNNISLAVNSASELELVSAVVSFQGKVKSINDKGVPVYKLFDEYNRLPKEYLDNPDMPVRMGIYNLPFYSFRKRTVYTDEYLTLNDRWINKTSKALNDGRYQMISGGEDLGNAKVNELYKFRTKYVDIANARDLIFDVREETEVSLKIIATFKEKNNPSATHVVLTNEYIIDEGAAVKSTTAEPFERGANWTRRRRRRRWRQISNNELDLNYYKDGVAYDSPQDCNCTPNRTGGKQLTAITEAEKLDLKSRFTLYPNPVFDKLVVNYTKIGDALPSILVSDAAGAILVNDTLMSDEETIDFSTYPQGTYLITIVDDGKFISKRVIKD
ncbi:T9SS type A sorting domain-containing protein [Aquimarina agarilytica]|uniref:T9SS type A sorting domain-containing protein n=1 Tax=Aquimarina agarilytica TaxID=1087449 RepID=UPI0002898A26|nr:T9SS type A sorting domain-containing protein [Aquimarina agarilytica]